MVFVYDEAGGGFDGVDVGAKKYELPEGFGFLLGYNHENLFS